MTQAEELVDWIDKIQQAVKEGKPASAVVGTREFCTWAMANCAFVLSPEGNRITDERLAYHRQRGHER